MTPRLIGLAEHPRAAPAIRRAKAWGAVGGFAAAALGSLLHGAHFFDAGVRALAGGVVVYLVVSVVATEVWRRLLQAEARRAVANALAEWERR